VSGENPSTGPVAACFPEHGDFSVDQAWRQRGSQGE
jgi:hypothetical protein